MNPLAIIGMAAQVFDLLPTVVDLGTEVAGLVGKAASITKNPDQATKEDVDAVLAAIDRLTQELNKDP